MNKKNNPVIIKRDSTINWKKAVNYIPDSGVVIIYDNEDGSIQLKIGDGESKVNDLPDILNRTSSVEDEVLQL